MRSVPASTWRNLSGVLAAFVCLCLIGLTRRALRPAPETAPERALAHEVD